MANCTGPCVGSVEDILTLKLNLERAVFIRLSQIVQAFGGTPVVNLPTIATISCADARNELLAALLEQKQANFNMLQQVLLAA